MQMVWYTQRKGFSFTQDFLPDWKVFLLLFWNNSKSKKNCLDCTQRVCVCAKLRTVNVLGLELLGEFTQHVDLKLKNGKFNSTEIAFGHIFHTPWKQNNHLECKNGNQIDVNLACTKFLHCSRAFLLEFYRHTEVVNPEGHSGWGQLSTSQCVGLGTAFIIIVGCTYTYFLHYFHSLVVVFQSHWNTQLKTIVTEDSCQRVSVLGLELLSSSLLAALTLISSILTTPFLWCFTDTLQYSIQKATVATVRPMPRTMFTPITSYRVKALASCFCCFLRMVHLSTGQTCLLHLANTPDSDSLVILEQDKYVWMQTGASPGFGQQVIPSPGVGSLTLVQIRKVFAVIFSSSVCFGEGYVLSL